MPRYLTTLLTVMACCLCIAFLFSRARSTTPRLRWKVVDGRWAESQGIISVLTYGRGDMEIAGKDSWSAYTFSGDLRYDLLFPETHYGDAGLVVRVSDASEGVDSYRGYYAGLRADDQMLVFGRADFGWHELTTVRLAAPVRPGAWYHMQVIARGCAFHVDVTTPGAQSTSLSYRDNHCKLTGAVGLRSFYAQSSWRNVSVHLD